MVGDGVELQSPSARLGQNPARRGGRRRASQFVAQAVQRPRGPRILLQHTEEGHRGGADRPRAARSVGARASRSGSCDNPTPALDWKLCQSISAAWTSLVAGHCVDAVAVEVHHRPRVAEFGLNRQRVREDLGVERIGVVGGKRGRALGEGRPAGSGGSNEGSEIEDEPVGAGTGHARIHAVRRRLFDVVEDRISVVG